MIGRMRRLLAWLLLVMAEWLSRLARKIAPPS